MTHNQEEILKKIVSLKNELDNIDIQVNKQLQSIIGQQTLDYNSMILSGGRGFGKTLLQHRETLKSEIMVLVEQLNTELGIDWDGKPIKDLYENLNNIELNKI